MSNIYNTDFNYWGYLENNRFIPKNHCGMTVENIKEVVNELIDEIEEKDDKLYVGEKVVMTDDYVKSGRYNGDGTATLEIGEDKTATIEDLPQPMSTDDVEDIMNKE